MERRVITFGGRVQGVGFRMTTVHLAKGLALGGTVKNLRDGRVELTIQGSGGDIDALVSRLREHFGAFIRTVDQETVPVVAGERSGIHIEP